MDRDAIDALNRAAQESFNVHGMETCGNCGRSFAEGRLAIHSKSCRPDSTAKRVGEGAAPRTKGRDAIARSCEVGHSRAIVQSAHSLCLLPSSLLMALLQTRTLDASVPT